MEKNEPQATTPKTEKLSKIKQRMQEDPNYKIEDDDELWIKLQFIECLRDK